MNECLIVRKEMENHGDVFDRTRTKFVNVGDEEFSFEINFVYQDIIENDNRRKEILHDYHWNNLLMFEDFQRRVNREIHVQYHVHN